MPQKKIAGLNLISQITSNNLANFRVKADRPDCPICPICPIYVQTKILKNPLIFHLSFFDTYYSFKMLTTNTKMVFG